MSFKKSAFVDEGFQAEQVIKKSPFVEGFKTGLKAALVAGPTAATYALLHSGKSPLLTGALGAIGGGLVFGGAGAATQEIQNRIREAEMRYHIKNMKEREPFLMMPPRELLLEALERQNAKGSSN